MPNLVGYWIGRRDCVAKLSRHDHPVALFGHKRGTVPVTSPLKPTVPENEVDRAALEEIRFTLRAPQFVFSQIDAVRRGRPGFVSRNTWILEAITERLQREILGRTS